ncbi:MAG: hypothetical protein JNG88_05245, partial [Phycisphaerales bacterium]|nr:hypothetical protein [Phycisphaerales bacterium]
LSAFGRRSAIRDPGLTIATLNEMARVASIGLRTAVGIASSFLPGAGLYDAFQAVQVIASGQGGFWEALDIAGAAFPAMKLAGDGLTALRVPRHSGRSKSLVAWS